MMKYPEIITLDNSDDDDSGGNSSLSRYVGATASIIHEKPLNFSALQPKRTAVSKLPPCTTVSHPFCRVRIPETPDTMILQRTSLSASHIEQQPRLELRNRAMLDTGNDTVDTTLSLSRTENNLDSYCYESYDPKAPPFEAQQFSAKFQCSVENCRMLLSNNISFMFHLWAHLTEFNYGTGLNCPREMHRFCRCPQCLHLFPTAYRLQIHYDNVHSVTPSSSTCKICEITVDESKHGRIHGDFDAPFHCRKCRYRTSMRSHFVDHFVRFHSNTRTLLCPFCLYCYVIPRENTLSVITEREYVRHFLLHQEENYGCDQCSLKFIRYADKITHRKDHSQPNLKWISKSVQIHTKRKGRKLWLRKKKRKCAECNERLNNICEHFKRMYCCSHCDYRTNCHTASQRHEFINCRKKRGGMTRTQLLPSLIVCNRCKRTSCIKRDILDHVRDCSGGRCIVIDLKQEKSNIFSQYNDELEMKIFALRHQEGNAKFDDRDVVADLYNCHLRSQNSLSPSLIKANMELNNTRLHILKKICPRPRFSFADMLKYS